MVLQRQNSREIDETKDDVFVESPARYLGLLGRVGRALKPLAAQARYLGYTSDVGEAFRPVVSPALVKATYGIAWAYVITDVGFNAYRTKQNGGTQNEIARAATHTATFQLLASIFIPMVVIHAQVDFATKACERVKSLQRYRRWGPTLAGLALIPLLPSLVDHPVETAVEWAFDRFWPMEHSNAGEIQMESIDDKEKKEL